MNEMFKEQIQRLINNPDILRADPAIRENLISDMRNCRSELPDIARHVLSVLQNRKGS